MGLKVGVVGVGPVGDRIVRVLDERQFPLDGAVTVMATSSRTEMLGGHEIQVHQTAPELFEGLDVCFFAGREGARGASVKWGHVAVEAGAVVIDNGGDFRLHPDYPLVVPEVNMHDVTSATPHICSPNCSTIQMVVALAPLHRAARIKRIVVSTYQSVSGWGQAAQEQLLKETPAVLAGKEPPHDPSIFARPIAFDCLPHIDRFTPSGYTKEELKMIHETRKILGEPNLLITATAVRVPVFVGHAESINVEFAAPMAAERAREILADPHQSPGVVLVDGPSADPCAISERHAPEELCYPVAADLARDEWRDMVLVGRVRDDTTTDHGINMWVVADNLRKGAATNTVQIAEKMIERGLLSAS